MDLHTIETIARPRLLAEVPAHRDGDAFLGGGTWLFSEPQPRLRRLVDLASLDWEPLRIGPDGLEIAATCTLATLAAARFPAQWPAASLVDQCCNALLGSFKIWNTATVGGNICLALPAGPMTSLAAALDGVCVLWSGEGEAREILMLDLVLGDRRTALRSGEFLRAVRLPAEGLRRRAAFRRISLTAHGRSAALLIGTRQGVGFDLTITAATPRPIRVGFAAFPDDAELASAIDAAVTAWFDDVHGAPDWRRHVTHFLARELRDELATS